MFSPLFIGHLFVLGGKSISLAVEERTSLELLSVQIQLGSKTMQFQSVCVLHEGPKLTDVNCYTAAHLIGHLLMIVSTLIEKQQPAHKKPL